MVTFNLIYMHLNLVLKQSYRTVAPNLFLRQGPV